MPDREARRERRRRECRFQRRTEQFVGILQQHADSIEEIKEDRPAATAITRVATVVEDGVGTSDAISISEVTDPVTTYNDPDRGWGFSEYRG